MTCMEPTPEIASALLYHTCEWPPDDRVTALGLHGKKSITNQRERHRKRKGEKYSLGSPELAAAINTFLALSQQNSLTLKILNEAFSLYRSLALSAYTVLVHLSSLHRSCMREHWRVDWSHKRETMGTMP